MARARGNRFEGDVLIDGRRIRKAFDTLAAAEAWERRKSQGLPDGAPDRLRAFAEDQFAHIWPTASETYVGMLRANLETVYAFFGEDTSIASMTTARCAEFVVWMKSDRYSNGTINRKLSALSKLLKRARRLDVIIARPELDFQREAKGRERVLSELEEKRLIERAFHLGFDYEAHLVSFLLYSGARVSEATKLSRFDELTDDYVMFRDTKNGDNRAVKLVGPAAAAWKWAKAHSNLDRPWQAVPRATFRHRWDRLRDDLGFSDDAEFVPHMLRHTCATRLVAANVSLPKVKEWMGHRNIQTTMRYAHLAPKDLDDCATALLGYGHRIAS